MRLARRGVDLDRHPSRAHALLGEPLWDLVQAGSARGPSVASGGIAASDLDSLIERLERI
jgi:hypothetical protein